MNNTFLWTKTKVMTEINIFDSNVIKMMANFSRIDRNYD